MKGLLRGVNELGKRQEKGGEDLFLRSAGSPSGLWPRAAGAAEPLPAESSAELGRVGLLQSLQGWNCSGTHPLVAGGDKSQHKPAWPLVFCALTGLPCSLFCVQWTSLTRVHHLCFPALPSSIFLFLQCPNLFCLSCKFLNFTVFKSVFISIWIVFKLWALKCPFSLSCQHTENTPYRLKTFTGAKKAGKINQDAEEHTSFVS